MAWNRPSETKKNETKGEQKNVRRGLIFALGALCLVLGLGAWYFLIGGPTTARERPDDTKGRGRIKEVALSLAKKVSEETVAKPVETVKAEGAQPVQKDLGYYTNKLGQVRKRTGEGVVVHGPKVKQIFKNRAEVVINAILSTRPGEVSYVYIPPNFQELFEQSLLEKIEFSEDDTPEDRAKKERMIEVKKELRKRWRDGENVADIIKGEQQYLQKMNELHRFYEGELRNLRNSGASEEEIAEFSIAAEKAMKEQNVETRLTYSWGEHKAALKIREELNQ